MLQQEAQSIHLTDDSVVLAEMSKSVELCHGSIQDLDGYSWKSTKACGGKIVLPRSEAGDHSEESDHVSNKRNHAYLSRGGRD